MKLTHCLLFTVLFMPVVLNAQNFKAPSLNGESDFAFFLRTLEKKSPLLQKMQASATLENTMSENDARALVEKKLRALNDKELDKTYAKLSDEQLVRVGFILYLLMNGLSDVPSGYNYDSKIGGGLGVFLMVTLANIIVMPELTLMWRAYGQDAGNTDYNVRFTYLSLAATVLYVIRATAINFVVGLSPNLGYALGGRVKYGDNKEDIEFGDNGANRLNFGIGITAGIQLKNAMMLRLIYNFGLSKLYDGSDVKSYFVALAFSMPLWSLK
jgi:hypothetical protein